MLILFSFFNYFWNVKILFNLRDERKPLCFRYLPWSRTANQGWDGDGVLGNVCSQQRQRCQFSRGYLGSVNPFDRTARNRRGHCFCLWFPFRPLTFPFSTPDQPLLGVLLSPSAWRGKGRDCEESIMELFKFVSNIEISFMPGKLIIEVYRRTRRRLRMPGIVRMGRGIGGEVNFLFFARLLFPIARAHQDSSFLSFALVHFAAREQGRLFRVA